MRCKSFGGGFRLGGSESSVFLAKGVRRQRLGKMGKKKRGGALCPPLFFMMAKSRDAFR